MFTLNFWKCHGFVFVLVSLPGILYANFDEKKSDHSFPSNVFF